MSALRRAVDPRPRRALTATALVAALAVPLLGAAPSAATPAPAAPIVLPADDIQLVTQYARTTVNVRSGPSTSHSVVGSYVKGTKVTGSWTSNGWLKIGTNRYIAGSVLVSSPPSYGDVVRYARTTVNVRSGPSTAYSVVGSYAKGTKVTGGWTSNGWLQIGSNRYIAGSVLTTQDPSAGTTGSAILAEAQKYVGVMYSYGGSSPSTGFDCSGYTQYVFGRLGISLPRSAAAQQSAATKVSSPQPGDLVFWGYPAWHVAIYAGNGYIYDSGKPGLPVQKRKMFSGVTGYGRAH
jgi:cell wall-associated NlpC family hydrolase